MNQAKLTYANYIMLAVDSICTRSKKLTTTYDSIADRAGVSPRILSNWKNQNVGSPQGNRDRAVLEAAFSLVNIDITESQFEALIEQLRHASKQSSDYQATFNVHNVISDVLTSTEKDAIEPITKANPMARTMEAPNRNNYRLMFLVGGVAVILIVGFALIFLNQRDQLPSAEATRGNIEALSEPEAAQQIEKFWQDGHAASLQGNNMAYHESMEHALQIARDYFGGDSEYYAEAQNHMIGALGGVGRYADAVTAAEEAIRVYSQLQGPQSFHVAQNKVNLAGKLLSLRQVQLAEEAVTEALAIYATLAPSTRHTIGYAVAHEVMSQIHGETRDYNAALPHAYEAISIIEEVGLTNRINYGWALSNAARLERDAGNCTTAKALFVDAIEAFYLAGAAEDFDDRRRAEQQAQASC